MYVPKCVNIMVPEILEIPRHYIAVILHYSISKGERFTIVAIYAAILQ